ncbi:hypothetical protein NMG60_11001060 [Bertholletia excelsa]
MEKESDVEDILNYRSAAESELQEFLLSTSSSLAASGANNASERSLGDERPSTRPRGWLNWLSRGMLGAGGTDDSIQFSGVVSDEVIKDIYEATEFQPAALTDGTSAADDNIFSCEINFHVHQVSATLWSMRGGRATAELIMEELSIECKLLEESAVITALINSTRITYPCKSQDILLMGRADFDNDLVKPEKPCLSIKLDISSVNQELKLLVQVMLQPLEVTYDSEFLLNVMEFYDVLEIFQFQSERVMQSLNDIEDVRTRILSKAEYVLSSRKKVNWDVDVVDVRINIPWRNADSGACKMVLEMGAHFFTSDVEDQLFALKDISSSLSTSDISVEHQLQDLYEHFKVKVEDVQMKVIMPYNSQTVTVMEKFGASISLMSCNIPCEAMLKQLEVHVFLPSLNVHFSPSVYGAVLECLAKFNELSSKRDSVVLPKYSITSSELKTQEVFHSSIIVNVESISLHINLENDRENSCALLFDMHKLDIRIILMDLPQCWISMKALKLMTLSLEADEDGKILCSSGFQTSIQYAEHQDRGVKYSDETESSLDKNTSANGCFVLHYVACRNLNAVLHKYRVCINDVDLHCYPSIIGLLVDFSNKILQYSTSHAAENSFGGPMESGSAAPVPCFEFEKFGCSNFYAAGSSDWASIPLDFFPFVTISNSGSLGNLEGSFIHTNAEWRNSLKFMDRKIRSPKFSTKGSKMFLGPLSNSGFCKAAITTSRKLEGTDVLVDLTLSKIKAYFHDCSCIVGTVSLPTSKSSLSIRGDCFDILCSTDGLTLCSSWLTQNIHDFLWGPALTNLSNILNVRVRKRKHGPLKSQFEISFGIQHVSCTLSPDFLAIIIGYFSLPDWSPSGNELFGTENSNRMDLEYETIITYKFEILDSTLFTPVESDNSWVLKLELPQLYCSFILDCSSNNLCKDIPPECLVRANKISKRSHCLNVFGQDLSLSLQLLSGDEFDFSTFEQTNQQVCITFITSFCADLWVRIPVEDDSACSSSPPSICVMARIQNGQLIAKDGFHLFGFKALLDVIDQFSSVEKESKGFTSDILQFHQFKKSITGKDAFQPEVTSAAFIETRFVVNSLSINFYQPRSGSVSWESVARADMQFMCSASFENEMPVDLDISFQKLSLFSELNHVFLVRCTTSRSVSSVFDIHLSISDRGENIIGFSLTSLEIWLHLYDWIQFVELLSSYPGQLTKLTAVDASIKSPLVGPVDQVDNFSVDTAESSPQSLSASSCIASENLKQNALLLIAKSKNIGVRIHIPVWLSGEVVSLVRETQDLERPLNDSCNRDGVSCSFIALDLESKCSELVFSHDTIKIKANWEKMNGTVTIYKGASSASWPFFQFSKLIAEAEVYWNQIDLSHAYVNILCDSLDVWLSYHIFFLWKYMSFRFPESDSDHSTLGNCELNIKLKKISLLLTDGKWSSKGPLLEILMSDSLLHAKMAENKLDSLVTGDLQVNYNNILKVLWEPFMEPWKFQLNINRIHEKSALLDGGIMTDIHLSSTKQLNLNITESFVEAIFRAMEIVKDAWGVMGHEILSENQRLLNSQMAGSLHTGRFAPYILQNLTSLPLVFHVCEGPLCADSVDILDLKDKKVLLPGSSLPIYMDKTPEEQLLSCRPTYSSDRLSDKQLNGVAHHYIIVQFDGTSVASAPISLDLVGLSYFYADFSKSSGKTEADQNGDTLKINKLGDEVKQRYQKGGFIIPVVCDVSLQRYCKLVRLYSTVILFNATSIPFEIRFDIPFGLSPKILDPVYPGQEFPLPLHLAEAGRMRWRPFGQNYLWSEAHNISNMLSQESRSGLARSFVCYPTHPSSHPFRCCISVQHMCFPSTGKPEVHSALQINNVLEQPLKNCGEVSHHLDKSKKHHIHRLMLSSPLVVKNYLPQPMSLTLESGGNTHTALLSEVETSFYHIDSSQELGITFHMHGFKPSFLKFPRTEEFCGVSKFSGREFSLSETIAFHPDTYKGPIYVTVDKVMDAFSGAREICIFVPYLLYNCTGFSLIISDSTNEKKGHGCVIPSCYNIGENHPLSGRKDGLVLFSSVQDQPVAPLPDDRLKGSCSKNRIVSTRKITESRSGKFSRKPIISDSSTIAPNTSDKHDLDFQETAFNSIKNRLSSSIQLNSDHPNLEEIGCRKVEACMYSPHPNSSIDAIMVRICRYLPECISENIPPKSWSSPFCLVQPTGSTSILVPELSNNVAYPISVTSSTVVGPFSGRTRAITFQPRYIICNACSMDLCYKQRGSESIFHLGTRQHSHLQWTDTARELLVSIRFNEPGWQWSGCFLPDYLGDTQLKMRNYISGAIRMIRVEVQNADVSIQDEKVFGSHHRNSGTNLVLLSDDDTGFMPYRIDNFSKERLRVYQQRCETFETIVQPYTSCSYAWDEPCYPCYPHRLTVEVLGERVVGSYTLDDVKDYVPVYLPSTCEKPERTLLVRVHAEGALKVLSIIDSDCHVMNDAKDHHVTQFQHEETSFDCKEKISIAIPFIGISLMNSYPQEILFACGRNTRIDLLQSLDQQIFSFQISSLQVDNQLPGTPYPVILSFHQEYQSNLVGQIRNRDNNTKSKNENPVQNILESPCEPVFRLAMAKWRNRDVSLVSFEYISLRMKDFHLELEQEIILALFDFFRTISLRSQVRVLTCTNSTLPLTSDLGFVKDAQLEAQKYDQPLPHLVVPIGAPWQQIYLLARRQEKIYVQMFDLSPINMTLSFSSSPWMLRNGVLTSGESLIHRGLMALADIEGAQIHLKQLIIAHQMASWDSIQDIIIRHYTRQFLHEVYKVFGSAGVIGNPMGFARSVGLGIKDFLSVPARSVFQSPVGLITGMAHGTTSLLSNTVYAISDAASQFSRAAHKGIVAFTFDDQAVAGIDKQQKRIQSHSKGVINEFLEGLTGLLQSPIKGAEKNGLLGALSGIAVGMTGLVGRPAASILEVTGKTAQSIRNRSKLHHIGGPQHLRVRLPRPLSRELPLRPYSWEEAIGTSVIAEADYGLKGKDEILLMCKALKQGGKFVTLTERFVLIVSCSSLVDLGKPEFRGVPADPEWVVEAEIGMDSIIHADASSEGVVHIVGIMSDPLLRQENLKTGGGSGTKGKCWNAVAAANSLPLYQTNLEFMSKEEAEKLLRLLLSTIGRGKERGWGYINLLHQSNIK